MIRDRVVLLLGRTGQVGHELSQRLATLGDLRCPDSSTLDLADPRSIRDGVRALRPSLIVNAAAYTAVDRAEREDAARSLAVNAVAPGIMAEEAQRVGATLVHFSTDYVFDGSSPRPYREDDPVAPINAYGRAKRLGEEAILATSAHAFVLRLGWVYDLERRNFLTTIRRVAAEQDELRVVDDQIGVPTWSGSVAAAVAQIVGRIGGSDRAHADVPPRGIYHLAGSGTASWAQFAAEILRAHPVPGRDHVRVVPIATSQYPTPARRPAYSVMDSEMAYRAFGVRLPDWREQLTACVRGGVPGSSSGR